MSSVKKQCGALFLNFALLANQVGAELQMITFEATEWMPGQSVSGHANWFLERGTALVSADGQGNSGGKALRIPAGLEDQTHVRRQLDWSASEPTAFVDFFIKPSAEAGGSLASVHLNGAQLSFLKNAAGDGGAVWVYSGNDYSTDAEAWREIPATFGLNAAGTASNRYLRVTVRQDYVRDIWDVFVDGTLVAANLGFEGRNGFISSIDFFNGEASDNFVDDLQALPGNMLFPDQDKDGLPDAWEIANGSNPNLYDRDFKPDGNKSFLESYMESLSPGRPVVTGRGVTPPAGAIPPLSLPAHQAVGSLKGSLSVGADGAASYSIPIDLPKGTAGMEPKLSLDYSSRGGNGLLGLGWSLGGLQTITRGPSTFARDGQFDPADFDANDRFFLNGQRLVCVGGGYGNPGSVYRTEIDSYARITAHGVGPSHWTVETKSGLKMTFGNSPDSRLSSPKGAMAWSVNEVQDTVGNYYTVNYHGAGEYGGFDEASHRVASIHYTGNTNAGTAPYIAVVFSYEDRPDIARAFSDNYGRLASKRLSKITVSTNGRINHSYRLGYVTSYQSGRSLLSAVTKHIDDSSSPALTVPATTFTYDGIRPEEALWQNPGGDPLPVFGTGLDATAAVNSMVDVQESDPTMIRLYGDVARAVPLPEGQITLQSDTRINFEFRSLKQGGGGAFIGVDADTAYQSQATSALFRIGGTGTVTLASGQTFTNNTQPYTVSDWKTFDFNLGQFGVGTVRKYLVLMCVDNNITDGADCAFFRNVRIYRPGTPMPAPIQFEAGTSLPRFSDILGRDLGVKVLDLNSDGLPDLADWRVVDYAVDTSSGPRKLIPQTTGYAYLNTGSAFEMNLAIRPGAHQPLGCRQTTENAWGYVSKHQLLATPVDVDMDGSLDLLSPVNLIADPDGTLRNDYTFFSWKNGAWTENPAWTLPFRVSNLGSSDTHGGKPRTVHFEWMDLNQDGYPDLVIHTTSPGKLVDRFNGTQLVGGNASVAYLNRGHAGTGWIRADEYALPVPLMQIEKDLGRRIVDVDGDGLPEIVESVATASLTSRTYRLKTSGTYRWNSLPGVDPPPADPYDLPAALAHTDGSATGTVLADLNGDGMPDLLKANRYATSNDFMAWINRGTSRYNPGPPPSGTRPWGLTEAVATDAASRAASYRLDYPLHVSNDNQMIPYGFQMADLNGDGLIDILYADIDNPNSPGPDNTAILNTGNGWSLRPEWGMPGNQRIFYSAAERNARQRSARLEDINGDGFPDLINGLLSGNPRVWLNNCRPEVLTAVTDGFGSNLTVDYRRLNDSTPSAVFGMPTYLKGTNLPAGQSAIIDARPVVYRYSQPNGSGGTHWHHLRYEDLRYDNKNATSLGFRVIVRQDVAAGQRVTTINSTEYPFAGSPLEVFTEALQTDQQIASLNPPSSPVVGNENISAGWKKLTHEWATFTDISEVPGIRRPCQTWGLKLHYNPTPVLLGRTETSQTFDQMGFVTSSTVSSLDDSQVVTSNTYAHRTNSFTDSHGTVDRWHIGRLITSNVTKSGAGQSSVTRHSVFTYDDRTGLLKSEEIEPGNALSSQKDYTYDKFGNITNTKITASAQTRESSAAYDSKGRFVVAETNGLNHLVSYLYDEGRARLESVTDANGLTTTYQYDAFGTRTLTLHPDGTRTGEITCYASAHPLPTAVSGHINGHIPLFIRATQTSGGPVTMVWLDLLGREIATETTILANVNATGNADHRKVYTVSYHNWRGLKTAVSQPFAPGETPKFTSITYDYLSRPLRTIHPDGTQDRVTGIFIDSVDGLPCNRTNSVSRNSQTLERWEDQHGRLVQSRDASGKITRFKHDLDGRLIQVSLDGQVLLTNKFDTFGNKTEVWEANSGTSTSTYNGFGEVVTSTNARGQQTTTTYDTLGRVETITRPNGEGTYTYQYDSAPGAGVGQVHSITGPDGYRDEFAYDFKGRPIRSVASRPNPNDGPAGRLETFNTFTTYDALGRVHSTTDAGGLTTLHTYDSHTSALISLKIGPGASGAGTTLWHAGTYDSQGRPLTQTLAHGITRSASYFPLTGLINTLGASMGGQAVQNLTVTWENEGNLLSRTDHLAGKSETFGYDSLNRLTSATIAGGASSGYSYDIKGNLLTKPGATLAYEGPRPHAVSSATLKGVAHTYQYDAAGYMTGDFVGGTLRRSFAWTSYGQLRRLDYTAAPALHRLSGGLAYGPADVRCDFLHDASGSRYLQRKVRTAPDASRVTEETLYLGSYERERHFTGTSSVPDRTVHRHSIGGFAVYTRTVESTGSVTRLSTILKDHLGSTDVIITGRWVATTFGEIRTERQSFDPWGERRDPSTLALFRQSATDPFRTSSEDHDRSYTGHEQLDDSGLIHMNGRIYDPELGRMLSPDPFVQVPEYSQNFNRYSYVLNNPLNKTDPSGYSWLSEAFDKVGDWFSENWRTVVVMVVVALVTWGVGSAFSGTALSAQSSTAFASYSAATATSAASASLTATGMAVTGGIAGAVGGGLSAGLAGGDLGDVLRGAVVGGIQGAIMGGMGGGAMDAFEAGNYGLAGAHVVGHGVVGGAANKAMGGKFQDGFISAATSAAAQMTPWGNGSSVKGAVKAGVVGGTASALGGGKFSNGAWTAAFQYILSDASLARQGGEFDETALKYSGEVYGTADGELLSSFGINYQQDYNKAGFGAALYHENDHYYLAMRGTKLTSGANWWANIKQALGFRTAQYNMAVDLAHDVYRRTGGNVTFVGHSLGGGLASAAAYATGGNAVTFNAAGLSWRYRIRTPGPGRITANYIRGDILSLGQDFTILPSAAGERLSFAGSGGVLARHGWAQFN